MKIKITIYLMSLVIISAVIGLLTLYGQIDFHRADVELGFYSILFGILGGCTHCLRSIYINASVKGQWDDNWNIWYFIRPFISGISGLISMLFIKAGLLIFNSGTQIDDRSMAYLAVAFLAGYNVKNFLLKIEDVSKVALGIEKKDN